MNELSKFLVESIMLGDNPIKKTVVIYVGRFQPFHKGHYGTYQHLVKKFGKDNVFIGSSNKTDKLKSPFKFNEKVKIMTTMFGIPKSKIHQVKNNYKPTEILKKFDEDTTAFVTVVGEKDRARLGGKYFQPYKGEPTEGYRDRGYVYVAPMAGNSVSGTEVRNGLSNGSDEQKKDFFTDRAFPKFNKTIFKLITDKLNEGIFISKEQIEEWLISESSKSGTGQSDDGPNVFFPNYEVFKNINIKRAAKIGYEIVNMITTKELEDYYEHPTYPNGPVKAVTPFPAGVLGAQTATNQVDIYSSDAYSKWFKHVTRKASLVGYSIVKGLETNKDEKKQSLDSQAGDKKSQEEFENSLQEIIKLPVEIGDTLLMGKFKNKKVVVKTIGEDEHGLPTINGKKVVTFRYGPKKPNVFEKFIVELAGTEVKCEKCNHQWEIESDDSEKYLCHSCGWDSQQQEYDFDAFDSWQEKMGLNEISNVSINEANAVSGGKVHKFITGKNLTYKGKKYLDIEFELLGIDNKSELVKLKILSPKGLFGNELNVPFKTIRRGPFLKTDNKGQMEGTVNEMSMSDLQKIDKFADKQLNPVDTILTGKHFFDRLNDPRNGKEVSNAELIGFFKRLGKKKKDFLNFLNQYNQIVVKDSRTNLNIPFMKQANKLIAKTIMRKNDFKSSDVKYTIESEELEERGKMRPADRLRRKASMAGKSKEIARRRARTMKRRKPLDKLQKIAYKMAYRQVYGEFSEELYPGIKKADLSIAQTQVVHKNVVRKKGRIIKRAKFRFLPALRQAEVEKFEKKNEDIVDQAFLKAKPVKEGLKDSGITDFKSLFKKMPSDLQKRVYNLKNFGQRVDKHPEGNVLKHTIMVVNRSIKEDDIDIAIAAMFHDIGKDETAGIHPKKGHITHFGHEKVSASLVKKYKKFIEDVGGNAANVFYIVKNHMRYKQLSDMRPVKQDKLKSFRAFDKLGKFSKHDKGGLGESKEKENMDSIDQLISDIDNKIVEMFLPNTKTPQQLIKENINESKLLQEGGAYGHMSHPFDTDINLTFGQLKDIVNRALEGTLEFTREKTDGQALAISWRDGRLVAARNKGHLKNKGENALDIKAVADKFAGRGELEKAYNFAMKDLSDSIKSLSEKQRDKVFKQGACFMNLEVIYPTSVNVIPYGQALLVFHGTMEFNMDGIAIGENGDAARVLAGMIKQVNKDVQDNYTIQGPPVIQLPKSQNLNKSKSKYSSQISKLQKEFSLKDTDGVANYHQAWWEQWVDKNSPTSLDNKTKMGLVKRWAFMEKGFRLDKNNFSDEKTLEWAKKTDKEDQKKIGKTNLMKFEQIFLGLGAEVLEFTSSALTVNPDKAVRDMKKRIDKTIKDVKKSGDPKKIEKLKLELGRLQSIGGSKKIVPNEGIVFVYNGSTFKLTGTFASVNQILGIFF